MILGYFIHVYNVIHETFKFKYNNLLKKNISMKSLTKSIYNLKLQ